MKATAPTDDGSTPTSQLHDDAVTPEARPHGLEDDLVVLMLEPRQFLRESLCSVLSLFRGVQTMAAATPEDYLASATSHPRPDLVLLCIADDERLPNGPGDMGAGWADLSSVPVVVLSNDRPASQVSELLSSGIRGFIPTSIGTEVAVRAIHLVKAGGTFVPASYLGSMLDRSVHGGEQREVFTHRQKQVLEALRQGKPNKIIAYELNMCESTVKVHVRTIMKKLKAKSRTQAAYLYSVLPQTSATRRPTSASNTEGNTG